MESNLKQIADQIRWKIGDIVDEWKFPDINKDVADVKKLLQKGDSLFYDFCK
jgi:hypothetical protein